MGRSPVATRLARGFRSDTATTPIPRVPLPWHPGDVPLVDATATLDESDLPPIESGDRRDRDAPLAPNLPLRYTDGRFLATGGMGDVWSYRDDVLGRRVAVKVLARHRRAEVFEREARVQARLSHPSVVPIHELGDDGGQPYLVMTQVEGETLATILERQRRGDADGRELHSQRQLLTAFVRVCQVVEYAHARGIVHRDLKPSNVMLGPLGAVYLLDWGIAWCDDGGAGPAKPPGIAGTLGYMAPEQIESARVDRGTDIYALGAILFEIVTRVPLHDGTDREALLASTLAGVDVRARAMHAQVVLAPEIAAICGRATANAPDARYGDVRALVTDLERFLDGERDEAGRRALADDLVGRARRRIEAAGADRTVLRDVGRALALSPSHRDAQEIMRRALAEGRERLPGHFVQKIADDDRADRRRGAVIAVVGIAAWLALFAGGIAFGIRESTSFVLFAAAITVATVAASYRAIRRGSGRRSAAVAAVAGAVALALLSRLAGPFMIAPTIAAALMPVFAFDHATHRRWILPLYASAVCLPWLAESLGWIAPTTTISTDAIVVDATMAGFSVQWSPTLLAATSLAALAVAYIAASRTQGQQLQHRIDRVRAAWQLEQLIPERVDDGARVE